MKWQLMALIVIPGTVADLLNTMGMKRNGEVCDFRPSSIFRLIASLARNPYGAVGCDLALLFPANFSFEMACWLTVEKYQDFTQASLPLKHPPSLIPVIPF